MGRESIKAYESADRVARYDADMDIMHPKRAEMIDTVLDVLPFGGEEALAAVDLGVGTGYSTKRFLDRFAQSRVIAIDGAAAMVELATSRLGADADRVTFVVADLRDMGNEEAVSVPVDVVFSSYTLHHLTSEEKRAVIGESLGLLRASGWFINADLVTAESETVEERIQQLRVAGIVERADPGDARFGDKMTTRRTLDELEAKEQDRPLTLSDDLRVAREAGLGSVEVFWKEYREAVWGGPK